MAITITWYGELRLICGILSMRSVSLKIREGELDQKSVYYSGRMVNLILRVAVAAVSAVHDRYKWISRKTTAICGLILHVFSEFMGRAPPTAYSGPFCPPSGLHCPQPHQIQLVQSGETRRRRHRRRQKIYNRSSITIHS